MSLWRFANPKEFMALSGRLVMPLGALAGLCLVVGLVWGIFFNAR